MGGVTFPLYIEKTTPDVGMVTDITGMPTDTNGDGHTRMSMATRERTSLIVVFNNL